ncbi:ShlB/FhaC/HecB family hemolysin secretion/activation protein [uncultured Phenylobacterium sp.]|uniref:ShlB/FhaC/HecB family hemolysin secretion/activation protein n=1 Tax=uncultured Phenylobacterium sp. TaxID=349273 RepID=UPI0025FA341E|nr:ShlB/FhaC/HecB family hemolysin secretion/activation protein [uncultured Phenylobacterium sp.]
MRPHVLALGALLAAAAPAALSAQPAVPDLEGRTGPRATPQQPDYARPTPGLVPPPSVTRAPGTAPADTSPLRDVRVASDGPHGPARPPRGWRPGGEADADLRLEHAPGEALDEAWVRRQFALNRLPGEGGVGRALALVQVINRAYLGAGFINSGLVVRPSADPAVLELRMIYGGLAPPADGEPALSVEWQGGGAKGLDADFVRQRMAAAARRPLSAVDLERDFRLLAEDPFVRTINADLRPGRRAGEASLAVSVYPQDRYDLYVTAANNRSPAVGAERIAAGGSVRNVLGPGDILSGEAGLTEGVTDVAVAYVMPLLSYRNAFSVRAAVNDAAVIDSLLAPLDIEAREKAFEVGFTRKLIDAPLLPATRAGRWSPARTLTAGFEVAHRTTRTELLGQPFSFAPGSVDGRSEYTALRLVGDYLVRNVDQVFAVALTATQGLDGTRSHVPGIANPHQDFRAILAQVNYARRLSAKGLELRSRLYAQWADGVLYSGERISAGGETTVRGYRENLLLADKGLVGSVEIAQPLSLAGGRARDGGFDWGAFTVSAFADGAVMRNHRAPQPQRSIFSVGAALAWTPIDAFAARATYGHALKDVEVAGKKDLQDHGLQFRMTVYPLRLLR